MNTSWESEESEVLFNPRFPHPVDEKTRLPLIKALKGHIWVATSGTTGVSCSFHHAAFTKKWTALSKEGILLSAAAVNRHLESTFQDIWVNPLPPFHVGGLAIFARAYLSKATVIDYYNEEKGNWDPLRYYQTIEENGATLSSLVPAHVYDLVRLGLKAPLSLRAIVVGGGAIYEALYFSAAELGWKLLPSYGLTECASQVATASLETIKQRGERGIVFPPLRLLPHVAVHVTKEGIIEIKSPSLLTTYAYTEMESRATGDPVFEDPKVDGWFLTGDRGMEEEGYLHVFGRSGTFLKIGGESVDLDRLEGILSAVKMDLRFPFDAALVAMPDERLGHVIHLASAVPLTDAPPCDGKSATAKLLEAFHHHVMPFERIRGVHFVERIPRSALNKVLRVELQRGLYEANNPSSARQ